MAQILPSESHPHESRLAELTDTLLDTRAAVPVAVLSLVAAMFFCAYAVHGYLNADCYASLHEAELDTEIVVLLDSAEDSLTGLRKGTANTSKWTNREFQDSIKEAMRILADGRQSIKDRAPLATIDSFVAIERSVARAKSLATDRVNFILNHQDPADYDAFEKYRLEGRNLVATVKELDAVLETLDSRPKKLPSTCNW